MAALQALAASLGHPDRVAYVPAEGNAQGLRDMGLLPDTLPGQAPLSDAGRAKRSGGSGVPNCLPGPGSRIAR